MSEPAPSLPPRRRDPIAPSTTPPAPLPAAAAPPSPPSPPPPPPPPARRAPAEPSTASSIKDTLESILVAFILAFVFRAFVVEAFVIPTGSMAPTLLGANMRYHCEDCGWDFTVNYSGANVGDDVVIPSRAGPIPLVRNARSADGSPVAQQVGAADKVFNIHCPNCGYKLRKDDTTNTPVYYGDRILVLKYLYLFQQPSRWDVVVFKSPYDPPGTAQRYQQNYIKRLVGRPGEQILILDGDVYTRPADADPWTIQPKSDSAQRALWRIIYDNDHHPQGLPRSDSPAWQQPWRVADGSGWDVGTTPVNGRAFRFDNKSGSGALAFDPDANPGQHAFTDWLAYDVTLNQQQPAPPDTFNAPSVGANNPVADLKLDCYYHRTAGTGPLRLELTKRGRTFIAELNPDAVTLLTRTGTTGPETQLGTRAALPHSAQPLHVEFSNVDYQLTVRVDGRILIRSSPADYAPDVESLLKDAQDYHPSPAPAVRITAADQTCTLEHLSLWRDIYYINRDSRLRWAVPLRYPENVMRLGKDEYFVLGDNSFISMDARFWEDPIDLPWENLDVQAGRVPGRFLLGKAFFVYWPAGYRVADAGPAFIPNFAQMRFIH